ncbi:MAG: hypothetical protein ACRD4M_01780 [Candidatus Acidiferrales bacterium]
MATASNSLTNVVQEGSNLLPAQNAKSARALQTATQNVPAQNTANDTVTLASQTTSAQAAGGTGGATAAQTAQPAEIIQYEQITITAEEIIVTGGGNNGDGANANPGSAQATTSAPATAAAPAAAPAAPAPVAAQPVANNNVAAAAAPVVNPAPVANTQNAPVVNAAALPAASALAGSTNSTQQQELAQLDQILQRMGVDPQSISIFNQLAMLLYVNDPVALQQFISTLQGAVPQPATQPAAVVAAAGAAQTQALAQNPAAASAAPQTTGQIPAANQGQQPTGNGPEIETLAFQATFAEVQVSPAGNRATNQGTVNSHGSHHHHHGRGNSITANANTGNVQGNQQNSGPQNGGYTLQFQELQLSFAAIGIEGGTLQAKPLTRAAAAGSGQGQALNVVA